MSCPLSSQFVLSPHRIFSFSLVVLREIRSHLHPVFADFLFAPCSHKLRFLICNGTFSVSISQCCVTYCCFLTRSWLTSDNILTSFGKRLMSFLWTGLSKRKNCWRVVTSFTFVFGQLLMSPPLLLLRLLSWTGAFKKVTSGYSTPYPEPAVSAVARRFPTFGFKIPNNCNLNYLLVFKTTQQPTVEDHKVKKVIEAHVFRYQEYVIRNTAGISVYMETCCLQWEHLYERKVIPNNRASNGLSGVCKGSVCLELSLQREEK